jgi:cytochrome P450
MSLHENEEVFKNALEFRPDRWLVGCPKELDRHLVPFGIGSRRCLGIQ